MHDPLVVQVNEIPGTSDVLLLQGKVLFSSFAPLEKLCCLRSAERLSLLCWASPTPPMPGEQTAPTNSPSPDPPGPGSEPEAGFAPRPEFAEEFAEFYGKQRPETALWLREFESILRKHTLPALQASLSVSVQCSMLMQSSTVITLRILPNLHCFLLMCAWIQAQEHVWRAAIGLEPGRQIAFRADVKRGGKRTSNCGVTSLLMEEMLGGLCLQHLGWRVDLKGWDLDLSMHWNEAQVVVEMPIFFSRSRCGVWENKPDTARCIAAKAKATATATATRTL